MRIITKQDSLNWGLSTKEFLIKNREIISIDVLLSLLEELEINIQITNVPVIGYFVSVGDGCNNYKALGDELTINQTKDLLFNLTVDSVEKCIEYNIKKKVGK